VGELKPESKRKLCGKSPWLLVFVESENIQTGSINHCNSSYFTMVSKDKDGTNARVPGLILSDLQELRRFINCIKQISLKKRRKTDTKKILTTARKKL
jgi:acyl-CoA hydrolase